MVIIMIRQLFCKKAFFMFNFSSIIVEERLHSLITLLKNLRVKVTEYN